MESKVYPHPFDEIFEACIQAIIKCGFTVDTEDRDRGIIVVSTHLTIFSWGEKIVIRTDRISDDRTKVEVESAPTAQLFDWGKSNENENRIIGYLDDLMGGDR